MCQIWLRSDGRVEKKWGVQTDRQRKLQLYNIVDNIIVIYSFLVDSSNAILNVSSYACAEKYSLARCLSLDVLANVPQSIIQRDRHVVRYRFIRHRKSVNVWAFIKGLTCHGGIRERLETQTGRNGVRNTIGAGQRKYDAK